jgi:hypothetical protein
MRIGRAIEQSNHFNYRKIKAVLSGTLNPDHLNRDEQEVYLDGFIEEMKLPQQAMQQHLSEQNDAGFGVGLDVDLEGKDKLVCAKKNNRAL